MGMIQDTFFFFNSAVKAQHPLKTPRGEKGVPPPQTLALRYSSFADSERKLADFQRQRGNTVFIFNADILYPRNRRVDLIHACGDLIHSVI